MANYKVVDSEKLDNDLSAVADSIKAKTNKNESLIFPEGFISAIDEIKTNDGDIGKPYIDTSKITDFSYFCLNNRMIDFISNINTDNGLTFSGMFQNCSDLNEVSSLNTSKGTKFQEMFASCGKIRTISQLDTSSGTNFSGMFKSCSNLTEIPQLDTSKGTNLSYMFQYCSNLTEIPQLDTSKGTNLSYMFQYCAKLETISLTTAKSDLATSTFQNCTALKNITIGEGWNVNIYLHYSNNLTVESLHGMIENLADLTGKTAKTFQIGATNLAKIDAEHLTMLQNKNWNYS